MPRKAHLAIIITLILSIATCTSMPPITTQVIVVTKVVTSTQGATATPRVVVIKNTPTTTQSPTFTPTPVPTLEGLSISVPDPRLDPKFSQLFDTKDTIINDISSPPILQFVNAMKMAGFELEADQVAQGITFQERKDKNGCPFILAVYEFDPNPNLIGELLEKPIPLVIATKDETDIWQWQAVTPGNYWYSYGKSIGLYMNGEEFHNPFNKSLVRMHFKYGILSLSGQVRPNAEPYRPPSNANSLAEFTNTNNMSLFFHYVAEPGKFPQSVNTENIDSWLDSRLKGVIKLIKTYKENSLPTYVAFNEAWEQNVWNPEYNPIRQKYGNQWLEEYLYLLLEKFIVAGLVPDRDFVIVFNDGHLYDRPEKQNIVFKALFKARQGAYNKLIADPLIKEKLNEMNISKPEDIDIVLGAETHILLGSENVTDSRRTIFFDTPTDSEITALSNKFESLGGIIMTEVNPNGGSVTEQEEFIERISTLLSKLPNLRGIILWNVFTDSDDNNPALIWGLQGLQLFDDMEPTKLYYALFPQE